MNSYMVWGKGCNMIKLAIDLGSSVTKMYRADTNSGIVLAEPSCVAVTGEEKEIKAIGKEAKNLIGKTAEYTRIIYPIYEGVIVDRELAEEMLKGFLSRIGIKKMSFRRAQILINIPCGLREKQLAEYAALAEECGLHGARFVEQPYLAALGGGAALSESDPVFCLDIGGGVTNVAVVSADGIIAGISLNIGGNNMDANILNKVARANKLKIGTLTAEKLKNEIRNEVRNEMQNMFDKLQALILKKKDEEDATKQQPRKPGTLPSKADVNPNANVNAGP